MCTNYLSPTTTVLFNTTEYVIMNPGPYPFHPSIGNHPVEPTKSPSSVKSKYASFNFYLLTQVPRKGSLRRRSDFINLVSSSVRWSRVIWPAGRPSVETTVDTTESRTSSREGKVTKAHKIYTGFIWRSTGLDGIVEGSMINNKYNHRIKVPSSPKITRWLCVEVCLLVN